MPDYAKVIRKSGNIDATAKRDHEKLVKALAEGAHVAHSLAQQFAPFRTGALRGSLFVKQEGELRHKVGSDLPYAEPQDKGTIYIEPTWFLTKAAKLGQEHARSLLTKK